LLTAAAKHYDEFICLDWDCYPDQPIPADLWEQLGKKGPIQMPLFAYKYPKCPWRADQQAKRMVPNGGWIYFRNNTMPQSILDHWDLAPATDLDETVMAHWMDTNDGGWKGVQDYYDRFEPYCISLPKTERIFGQERLRDKRGIFIHVHPGNVV
jgi:hypothetical protein